MSRSYTPEFKKSALNYLKDHRELTNHEAAENLGVPYNTLYGWIRESRRQLKPKSIDEATGNLFDLEKENLRLQRDALEILKKAISIL